MTKKYQKISEKKYAETASQLLNESWIISLSPNETHFPDLIVTTDVRKFGLEVREIFSDETDRGSITKIKESINMLTVDQIANDYYKLSSAPINVKLLGDISNHKKILYTIVDALPQLIDFESKRLVPYRGCVIHVTKLPNSLGEDKKWIYITDKTGWLSVLDRNIIDEAIASKSKNITRYLSSISEVSLLLVCNRIYNSGKFIITEDIITDKHGFDTIYFLSYPESIWTLSS